MNIDRSVPIPLYYQLKEALKALIERGEIKPGERIPSENELSRKYNITRMTVRQAIKELINEGWLYTRRGVGTFCAAIPEQEESYNIIGVILPTVASYIFPQIVRGIDDVINGGGYRMMLLNTNESLEREGQQLRTLIDKKVRGAIIERTKSAVESPNRPYFEELRARGIPIVFIDSYIEGFDSSCVILDEVKGAAEAVEYLIRLGHRRIGCIYKGSYYAGAGRLEGYRLALERNNIEYDERLTLSYDVTGDEKHIYALARRLLSMGEGRPTAIFCFNDQCATQAYNAARDEGLEVPRDLSIVGFDDSDLALLSKVPLTTVSHPKYEMGKKAAEILMSLIEGSGGGPQRYVFVPNLVVRKSCSPPSQREK
ncbi:MAG: GntR family transcriptional regulator [bacterium]